MQRANLDLLLRLVGLVLSFRARMIVIHHNFHLILEHIVLAPVI